VLLSDSERLQNGSKEHRTAGRLNTCMGTRQSSTQERMGRRPCNGPYVITPIP
jgi:hypothetical protein